MIVEDVVQHSPDGSGRIVRRRHPTGHRTYVIERLVDGVWVRSENGPWDYLSNARIELNGIVPAT